MIVYEKLWKPRVNFWLRHFASISSCLVLSVAGVNLELRPFPKGSHAWQVILKLVWRAEVWPGPSRAVAGGLGLMPQAPSLQSDTQNQLLAKVRTLIYETGWLRSNQPWGPPRWWHKASALQTHASKSKHTCWLKLNLTNIFKTRKTSQYTDACSECGKLKLSWNKAVCKSSEVQQEELNGWNFLKSKKKKKVKLICFCNTSLFRNWFLWNRAFFLLQFASFIAHY